MVLVLDRTPHPFVTAGAQLSAQARYDVLQSVPGATSIGKLTHVPAPSWILIDGYNLLHASGVFGTGGRTSLESSREALLNWLSEMLSDAQRHRTTIVFDARDAPPGLPRTAVKNGLKIRFAPRGCEADDVLEDLIEEHSTPRRLIVVSSDHRVQRAARRRRSTAIDSDLWAADARRQAKTRTARSQEGSDRDGSNLDEKPAGDEKLAGDELQSWLDEFSED